MEGREAVKGFHKYRRVQKNCSKIGIKTESELNKVCRRCQCSADGSQDDIGWATRQSWRCCRDRPYEPLDRQYLRAFFWRAVKRSTPADIQEREKQLNTSLKYTIDHELLETVMLEMLEEAGVRLRLYTFASDEIMDGNTIMGVITESKSGR